LLELNRVRAGCLEAELIGFEVRATGVDRVDLLGLLDPGDGVFRVTTGLDLTVAAGADDLLLVREETFGVFRAELAGLVYERELLDELKFFAVVTGADDLLLVREETFGVFRAELAGLVYERELLDELKLFEGCEFECVVVLAELFGAENDLDDPVGADGLLKDDLRVEPEPLDENPRALAVAVTKMDTAIDINNFAFMRISSLCSKFTF